LICSTGIGRNYSYPDTDSDSDQELSELDEFDSFLLGETEDSPFYESRLDIQEAIADLNEGFTENSFFEFNPLNSKDPCNLEILLPTVKKETVSPVPVPAEAFVATNVTTIDASQFCIVCGGVKRPTCLDDINQGFRPEELPKPARINPSLVRLLERQLFQKDVIPTWDTRVWHRIVADQYRTRISLARINPDYNPRYRRVRFRTPLPELEKQWRDEIKPRPIPSWLKKELSTSLEAKLGSVLIEPTTDSDQEPAFVIQPRMHVHDGMSAQSALWGQEAIQYTNLFNPIRDVWTNVQHTSAQNESGYPPPYRVLRIKGPDETLQLFPYRDRSPLD
jgi:hypothetical protein